MEGLPRRNTGALSSGFVSANKAAGMGGNGMPPDWDRTSCSTNEQSRDLKSLVNQADLPKSLRLEGCHSDARVAVPDSGGR